MKIIAIILICFLTGCAIQIKHKDTTVSFLCYQDDRLLPNGMYASDEVRVKCNGRRLIQFKAKFGGTEKSDPLNFQKVLGK